jgi:very-short-patch-repair endonuclease
MARYYRKYRRYYDYEDYNDIEHPIEALVTCGILFLLYEFYINRAAFWRWLIFSLVVLLILGLALVVYMLIKNKLQKILQEKYFYTGVTHTTAEIPTVTIEKSDLTDTVTTWKARTSSTFLASTTQTLASSPQSSVSYEPPPPPTPSTTPQAQLLHDALIARGIKCTLEKWDGNKHIDIAIPWARINIEIDGNHHYINPNQMTSDLQRDYYSARKGFKTIRIPNIFIENNLDKVADGISQVARDEYYKRHHKN